MEETENGPVPFEDTPVPPGTPRYLFSYSLLEKERPDGIVGSFKFVGFFDSDQELQDLYAKSLPTNKQTQLAWAIPGEWEILRQPYTNIEGPLTVVDYKNEELKDAQDGPGRVKINDPATKEEIMDRFSIDAYKAQIKEAEQKRKKVELRRKALEELKGKFDDSNSLAYYSRLQYQRLAQRDHIDDLQNQIDNAVKMHSNSVKELRELTRRFPHYKDQWQSEIRKMQKLMSGKESKLTENPADNDPDTWEHSPPSAKPEKDEFNEGILLEDKGKDEDDNTFYEKSRDQEEKKRLHEQLEKQYEELSKANEIISRQREEIANSFLPEADNKVKKKKKDKKKKKEKKPPQAKKKK